ncbi:MAG: outer membrane protein assembly factor BamD [Planctomycetaceae bacterium]|nr:outer membrane protein assembly factor BamD [Planctomycetaceae bacterium]
MNPVEATRRSTQSRARFNRACVGMLCAILLSAGCSIPLKMPAMGHVGNPFKKSDAAELARRANANPERGMDEFRAAEGLYEEGKFVEAESKFKAICKKHKDYLVEEDARFMLAECQFRQKRYSAAQDNYDELLKKFPSTRHMDSTTKRLYSIASTWLGNNKAENSDRMTQVGFDDVKGNVKNNPLDETPHRFPLKPNFFDKSRPVFDTNGRALLALKAVWMNDPTGPLADDALMMTAGYYILSENYVEADHYLSILREEYPKSEYAQKAYQLGPHVKLMNYQGAMYDPKPLQEAKTLLQASMNSFDDPENQERMQQEMEEVRARAAEEAAAMARFWERKGKPGAAAIYHELLLKNYPDTPVSEESREYLSKLDPKYRQGIIDQYPEQAKKPEIQQASNRWRLGGRRRRTVAPPEEDLSSEEEERMVERDEADYDAADEEIDDDSPTGLPQEFEP